MAIKIKAVERLLKFDKEKAGEYRYVMSAELYSKLSQSKVVPLNLELRGEFWSSKTFLLESSSGHNDQSHVQANG